MISNTINIEDQASAELQAIALSVSPEALNQKIGASVALLFQKHFLALPSNKQGFTSSGFWSQAARSTNFFSDAAAAVINVNQVGVRQRLEGGEIKPGPGKTYLTIPACSEAYAKGRSGEFATLKFGFALNQFGHMQAALVEAEATQVKFGPRRKDGSQKVTHGADLGGKVFYWLAHSVKQKGNPNVIPSEQEITETALSTIHSLFDRL